jgi:hypothetical protein
MIRHSEYISGVGQHQLKTLSIISPQQLFQQGLDSNHSILDYSSKLSPFSARTLSVSILTLSPRSLLTRVNMP